MTDIAQIAALVDQNIRGGRPPFAGTPVDTDALEAALAGTFDLGRPFGPGATCHTADGACVVAGTVPILDLIPVAVTCTFRVVGGNLHFELGAPVPSGAFHVPGLEHLVIGGGDIEVDVGGLDAWFQSVVWSAGATLGVAASVPGAPTVDVRLYGPAGGDTWRLEAGPSPGSRFDLHAAATLLGAEALVGDLPATLSGFASLSLASVEADFDPKTKTLPLLAARIESSDPWPILPGTTLALNQPVVTLSATGLGAGQPPAFAARLDGVIGSVPITVMTADSNSLLLFELAHGAGVTLGRISELATVLGADALPPLPAGLTELEDLTLSDLQVEVSLEPPALARAAARVSFPGPWRFGSAVNLRDAVVNLAIEQPLQPDQRRAAGSFSAWVDLGGTPVYLAGETDGEALSFDAAIGRVDLPTLAHALVGDLPFTLPAGTALESGAFSYSSDSGLHIDATTSIDVIALARALGIALPEGFETLTLDGVTFDHDRSGRSSIAVRAAAALAFPPGSGHGATVSELCFEIRRDDQGRFTTAASFVLNLDIALSEDFTLKVDGSEASSGGLRCAWDGEHKAWSVHGRVAATLFGVDLPALSADVSQQGDRCLFSLRHEEPISLLNLEHLASVNVSGLMLTIEREEKGAGCDWRLHGKSDLEVASVCRGDGEVSLEKTNAGWRITVSASNLSAPSLTVGPITSHLTIATLVLRAGSAANSLFLEADDVELGLTGLPHPVDKCLPSVLRGSLHCDRTGATLTLIPPEDFRITFPPLALPLPDGTTRSLGQPSIALTTVGMQLGSTNALTADLCVGVPPGLNALLGTGHDGRLLLKDSVSLELAIGTTGIAFRLPDSPFNAIAFHPRDGHPDERWFDWTLPCGDFSFRVPEFKLQGESFSAHGGVERRGDLKIPLGWLKALLATPAFAKTLGGRGVPASRLATLTAALPDAIPLVRIDLHQALGALKACLARDPDLKSLADAIGELQELERRLPARLREYLGLDLPAALNLDISVDAAGGFAFRFSTNRDTPLRVLLPGPTGLTGLTVRAVSLGLALGGTVIRAEVDADIDAYGFVDIAIALVGGAGDQYGSRILLQNTRWLAPTEFPLPVPVFYELLGWEYQGILGEVQTHWSFLYSQPTLAELIQIFGSLYRFATVPNQELDPDFIPDHCAPRLELGVNRLVLPAFLGGAQLTLNQQPITLSVSASLARLLDAAKFLNPAFLIQAIPLKSDGQWLRIGRETIDVGPLHFGASWCVTTEQEYRDVVLEDSSALAMLDAANAGAVLETLPKTSGGQALDRGCVILLTGETTLAEFVGFKVELGAALTAIGGLETGVRLVGTLGSLETRVEGRVQVSKPQGKTATSRIEIEGQARLLVGNRTIIESEGDVLLVPGDRFEATVNVALSTQCGIHGKWVIAKSGMTIDGSATWSYAPGRQFSEAAHGEFSKDGMSVSFKATLFSCTGQARAALSRAGAVSAAVSLDIPAGLTAIFPGRIVDAASLVEQDISTTLDQIGQTMQRLGGVPASIAGVRKMLPPLCGAVIGSMDKAISDGVEANWSWTYGAVVTKNQLVADARSDLANVYGVFQRLEAAAATLGDDALRQAVDTEVRTLIANRHVVVKAHLRDRYSGHDWVDFVIWQGDLLGRSDIAQLLASLLALKYLPAQSQATVPATEVYNGVISRKTLLENLRGAVSAGGSGPTIKGVEVSTTLEVLPAQVGVTVTVAYQNADHQFSLQLDLGRSLTDSAAQLASGFVTSLLPG